MKLRVKIKLNFNFIGGAITLKSVNSFSDIGSRFTGDIY